MRRQVFPHPFVRLRRGLAKNCGGNGENKCRRHGQRYSYLFRNGHFHIALGLVPDEGELLTANPAKVRPLAFSAGRIPKNVGRRDWLVPTWKADLCREQIFVRTGFAGLVKTDTRPTQVVWATQRRLREERLRACLPKAFRGRQSARILVTAGGAALVRFLPRRCRCRCSIRRAGRCKGPAVGSRRWPIRSCWTAPDPRP